MFNERHLGGDGIPVCVRPCLQLRSERRPRERLRSHTDLILALLFTWRIRRSLTTFVEAGAFDARASRDLKDATSQPAAP